MFPEPLPAGNVLGVSQLRGCDLFTVKILKGVDPRIRSYHQPCPATGCTAHNPQGLTFRFQIAVYRRVGANVGEIKLAGKEGFDGRRPRIKELPLYFDLLP